VILRRILAIVITKAETNNDSCGCSKELRRLLGHHEKRRVIMMQTKMKRTMLRMKSIQPIAYSPLNLRSEGTGLRLVQEY